MDAMEKKNKQKKTTQQQLCVLEFSRVPIRYKRNLFCSPHLLQANFILLLHFYYLFILISFTHDSVPLSCHVLSRRCKVRGVASLKKKKASTSEALWARGETAAIPTSLCPSLHRLPQLCMNKIRARGQHISVETVEGSSEVPLTFERNTHTHMGHSKGYMYVFIY